MRLKTLKIVGLIGILLLCNACRDRYVPKPYGYFRIHIPDTAYIDYNADSYPYRFEQSANAVVQERIEKGEQFWIDITYPEFNADIHCSYKPIQHNLRELSDDAQKFVYKHASKASAIPEQEYTDDEKRIYGVYYELQGNTASPYQFYLTDSIEHFFRGAVYFNNPTNPDSLAPVIDYMKDDIRHLIETFEWK